MSAVGQMVQDAEGDTETIKKIKEKQIFGVELSPEIYPLAVSNMCNLKSKPTNIIYDNCFNERVKNFIKGKRPTVGLLNPPYKADKKNDVEELEYVLNNLECLVEGGKCVALVPMQCALSVKGKILHLKEKILKHHTLEAVLSMPDELFFNSKVSVVTCVMVLTAHKPHPPDKEAFFGYFKEDGFGKNKIQGRADIRGKWEDICKMWLEHFINNRSKPGLSVVRVPVADEEWCAEAYMETDYSKITEKDFIETVKKYVAYKFLNPAPGE